MPQVPYSGVADTTLQQNATPNRSVNTPLDAFGGNVATATQGLGKAVEGAGDELFKRGMAMQELFNHSEANQAAADYMEKAGNLHESFKQLQGKDAVQAYPDYVKSLKTLRNEIQGGLSNDMSRKLFETSSLSTMGRTIFSGAEYSGQQNKRYAIGTNEARIQAVKSATAQQPQDDTAFSAGLELVKQQATQKAQLELGSSVDQTYIDSSVRVAQQGLWADRILSLSKDQPFTAQKYLDEAAKQGMIKGEDLAKVTQVVQTAKNNIGARQIAKDVQTGADFGYGAKIVAPNQAREAIGTFESGNRYDAQGPDVGNNRGRALGRYQVMPENLPAWLKEAGLPPMSPQEFLKSPATQDKLFDTVFGRLMKETGSFNGAAAKWIGPGTDVNGTDAPKYIAATNAVLAKNASLTEKIERGKAKASEIAPDDVQLPDYVEQSIRTNTANAESVRKFDEAKNMEVMSSAIEKGKPDGGTFKDIAELSAFSPEAAEVYRNLSAPKQLQMQKNIVAYNNANTKITNRDNAEKLQGLAHGSPEEVDKFLNTNIYQEPLNRVDMDRFSKLQRQLQKDRGGSVEIRQALKMADPILTAAGVELKDKEVMAKFRGAYIDSIYDWKAANPNKPLDEKTAKVLASQAVQKGTSENFWYGKDYMFNLPLPKSISEKIKVAKPDISDGELEIYRQEYVRQQLQALQKSKAPKGPNG